MVSETVIGDHCMIGVGVKIIRKFPYRNVPQLGSRVYVGPGAVICGPVKIGNNVIIAPNAVVTRSIPDDCIVGGIPGKIIGKTTDLNYDIFENPKYKDGFAEYLHE